MVFRKSRFNEYSAHSSLFLQSSEGSFIQVEKNHKKSRDIFRGFLLGISSL
tara:strand:- start:399 stop:551 length:153 start_codon:yes stop_codon:yes gene_type:complete